MKKSIFFIATTIVLSSSGLLFNTPIWAQETKPSKPALTITSAAVQRQKLPITLSANGNIAAWQDVSVSSEVAGLRLVELHAEIGETVKQGQLLASFANEQTRAELIQAQAELTQAQAQLKEAEASAKRAESIKTSGALSEQQLDQYQLALATAQARASAAAASLSLLELRLKNTQLLAPDHGVVAARTGMLGAVVGTGAELFKLIRQGRLEWRGEVTATELPRLKIGQSVTVLLPDGQKLSGKLRQISPVMDPQTRQTLVYVDLPGAKVGPVKPGMFARGEFNLGQTDALTINQQSLVSRDGFDYVFILGSDLRVSQRKVQTGRRVGDRVEIVQGSDLNTATVVEQGAGFLNDGDSVRVQNAPKVAPPPPRP